MTHETDGNRRALQAAVLSSKEYERRLFAELERAESEITKLRNSVICAERERDTQRAAAVAAERDRIEARAEAAELRRELQRKTPASGLIHAARERISELERNLQVAEHERDPSWTNVEVLERALVEARARVAELEDHPPGIGDEDIQRVFRERDAARARVAELESLSQASTVQGSDKPETNSEPHRNHSQPHSGTIDAARAEALEEAAKVAMECDWLAGPAAGKYMSLRDTIAAAIRALGAKP